MAKKNKKKTNDEDIVQESPELKRMRQMSDLVNTEKRQDLTPAQKKARIQERQNFLRKQEQEQQMNRNKRLSHVIELESKLNEGISKIEEKKVKNKVKEALLNDLSSIPTSMLTLDGKNKNEFKKNNENIEDLNLDEFISGEFTENEELLSLEEQEANYKALEEENEKLIASAEDREFSEQYRNEELDDLNFEEFESFSSSNEIIDDTEEDDEFETLLEYDKLEQGNEFNFKPLFADDLINKSKAKEKELELKQKELELKEKELALKAREQNTYINNRDKLVSENFIPRSKRTAGHEFEKGYNIGEISVYDTDDDAYFDRKTERELTDDEIYNTKERLHPEIDDSNKGLGLDFIDESLFIDDSFDDAEDEAFDNVFEDQKAAELQNAADDFDKMVETSAVNEETKTEAKTQEFDNLVIDENTDLDALQASEDESSRVFLDVNNNPIKDYTPVSRDGDIEVDPSLENLSDEELENLDLELNKEQVVEYDDSEIGILAKETDEKLAVLKEELDTNINSLQEDESLKPAQLKKQSLELTSQYTSNYKDLILNLCLNIHNINLTTLNTNYEEQKEAITSKYDHLISVNTESLESDKSKKKEYTSNIKEAEKSKSNELAVLDKNHQDEVSEHSKQESLFTSQDNFIKGVNHINHEYVNKLVKKYSFEQEDLGIFTPLDLFDKKVFDNTENNFLDRKIVMQKQAMLTYTNTKSKYEKKKQELMSVEITDKKLKKELDKNLLALEDEQKQEITLIDDQLLDDIAKIELEELVYINNAKKNNLTNSYKQELNAISTITSDDKASMNKAKKSVNKINSNYQNNITQLDKELQAEINNYNKELDKNHKDKSELSALFKNYDELNPQLKLEPTKEEKALSAELANYQAIREGKIKEYRVILKKHVSKYELDSYNLSKTKVESKKDQKQLNRKLDELKVDLSMKANDVDHKLRADLYEINVDEIKATTLKKIDILESTAKNNIDTINKKLKDADKKQAKGFNKDLSLIEKSFEKEKNNLLAEEKAALTTLEKSYAKELKDKNLAHIIDIDTLDEYVTEADIETSLEENLSSNYFEEEISLNVDFNSKREEAYNKCKADINDVYNSFYDKKEALENGGMGQRSLNDRDLLTLESTRNEQIKTIDNVLVKDLADIDKEEVKTYYDSYLAKLTEFKLQTTDTISNTLPKKEAKAAVSLLDSKSKEKTTLLEEAYKKSDDIINTKASRYTDVDDLFVLMSDHNLQEILKNDVIKDHFGEHDLESIFKENFIDESIEVSSANASLESNSLEDEDLLKEPTYEDFKNKYLTSPSENEYANFIAVKDALVAEVDNTVTELNQELQLELDELTDVNLSSKELKANQKIIKKIEDISITMKQELSTKFRHKIVILEEAFLNYHALDKIEKLTKILDDKKAKLTSSDKVLSKAEEKAINKQLVALDKIHLGDVNYINQNKNADFGDIIRREKSASKTGFELFAILDVTLLNRINELNLHSDEVVDSSPKATNTITLLEGDYDYNQLKNRFLSNPSDNKYANLLAIKDMLVQTVEVETKLIESELNKEIKHLQDSAESKKDEKRNIKIIKDLEMASNIRKQELSKNFRNHILTLEEEFVNTYTKDKMNVVKGDYDTSKASVHAGTVNLYKSQIKGVKKELSMQDKTYATDIEQIKKEKQLLISDLFKREKAVSKTGYQVFDILNVTYLNKILEENLNEDQVIDIPEIEEPIIEEDNDAEQLVIDTKEEVVIDQDEEEIEVLEIKEPLPIDTTYTDLKNRYLDEPNVNNEFINMLDIKDELVSEVKSNIKAVKSNLSNDVVALSGNDLSKKELKENAKKIKTLETDADNKTNELKTIFRKQIVTLEEEFVKVYISDKTTKTKETYEEKKNEINSKLPDLAKAELKNAKKELATLEKTYNTDISAIEKANDTLINDLAKREKAADKQGYETLAILDVMYLNKIFEEKLNTIKVEAQPVVEEAEETTDLVNDFFEIPEEEKVEEVLKDEEIQDDIKEELEPEKEEIKLEDINKELTEETEETEEVEETDEETEDSDEKTEESEEETKELVNDFFEIPEEQQEDKPVVEETNRIIEEEPQAEEIEAEESTELVDKFTEIPPVVVASTSNTVEESAEEPEEEKLSLADVEDTKVYSLSELKETYLDEETDNEFADYITIKDKLVEETKTKLEEIDLASKSEISGLDNPELSKKELKAATKKIKEIEGLTLSKKQSLSSNLRSNIVTLEDAFINLYASTKLNNTKQAYDVKRASLNDSKDGKSKAELKAIDKELSSLEKTYNTDSSTITSEKETSLSELQKREKATLKSGFETFAILDVMYLNKIKEESLDTKPLVEEIEVPQVEVKEVEQSTKETTEQELKSKLVEIEPTYEELKATYLTDPLDNEYANMLAIKDRLLSDVNEETAHIDEELDIEVKRLTDIELSKKELKQNAKVVKELEQQTLINKKALSKQFRLNIVNLEEEFINYNTRDRLNTTRDAYEATKESLNNNKENMSKGELKSLNKELTTLEKDYNTEIDSIKKEKEQNLSNIVKREKTASKSGFELHDILEVMYLNRIIDELLHKDRELGKPADIVVEETKTIPTTDGANYQDLKDKYLVEVKENEYENLLAIKDALVSEVNLEIETLESDANERIATLLDVTLSKKELKKNQKPAKEIENSLAFNKQSLSKNFRNNILTLEEEFVNIYINEKLHNTKEAYDTKKASFDNQPNLSKSEQKALNKEVAALSKTYDTDINAIKKDKEVLVSDLFKREKSANKQGFELFDILEVMYLNKIHEEHLLTGSVNPLIVDTDDLPGMEETETTEQEETNQYIIDSSPYEDLEERYLDTKDEDNYVNFMTIKSKLEQELRDNFEESQTKLTAEIAELSDVNLSKKELKKNQKAISNLETRYRRLNDAMSTAFRENYVNIELAFVNYYKEQKTNELTTVLEENKNKITSTDKELSKADIKLQDREISMLEKTYQNDLKSLDVFVNSKLNEVSKREKTASKDGYEMFDILDVSLLNTLNDYHPADGVSLETQISKEEQLGDEKTYENFEAVYVKNPSENKYANIISIKDALYKEATDKVDNIELELEEKLAPLVDKELSKKELKKNQKIVLELEREAASQINDVATNFRENIVILEEEFLRVFAKHKINKTTENFEQTKEDMIKDQSKMSKAELKVLRKNVTSLESGFNNSVKSIKDEMNSDLTELSKREKNAIKQGYTLDSILKVMYLNKIEEYDLIHGYDDFNVDDLSIHQEVDVEEEVTYQSLESKYLYKESENKYQNIYSIKENMLKELNKDISALESALELKISKLPVENIDKKDQKKNEKIIKDLETNVNEKKIVLARNFRNNIVVLENEFINTYAKDQTEQTTTKYNDRKTEITSDQGNLSKSELKNMKKDLSILEKDYNQSMTDISSEKENDLADVIKREKTASKSGFETFDILNVMHLNKIVAKNLLDEGGLNVEDENVEDKVNDENYLKLLRKFEINKIDSKYKTILDVKQLLHQEALDNLKELEVTTISKKEILNVEAVSKKDQRDQERALEEIEKNHEETLRNIRLNYRKNLVSLEKEFISVYNEDKANALKKQYDLDTNYYKDNSDFVAKADNKIVSRELSSLEKKYADDLGKLNQDLNKDISTLTKREKLASKEKYEMFAINDISMINKITEESLVEYPYVSRVKPRKVMNVDSIESVPMDVINSYDDVLAHKDRIFNKYQGLIDEQTRILESYVTELRMQSSDDTSLIRENEKQIEVNRVIYNSIVSKLNSSFIDEINKLETDFIEADSTRKINAIDNEHEKTCASLKDKVDQNAISIDELTRGVETSKKNRNDKVDYINKEKEAKLTQVQADVEEARNNPVPLALMKQSSTIDIEDDLVFDFPTLGSDNYNFREHSHKENRLYLINTRKQKITKLKNDHSTKFSNKRRLAGTDPVKLKAVFKDQKTEEEFMNTQIAAINKEFNFSLVAVLVAHLADKLREEKATHRKAHEDYIDTLNDKHLNVDANQKYIIKQVKQAKSDLDNINLNLNAYVKREIKMLRDEEKARNKKGEHIDLDNYKGTLNNIDLPIIDINDIDYSLAELDPKAHENKLKTAFRNLTVIERANKLRDDEPEIPAYVQTHNPFVDDSVIYETDEIENTLNIGVKEKPTKENMTPYDVDKIHNINKNDPIQKRINDIKGVPDTELVTDKYFEDTKKPKQTEENPSLFDIATPSSLDGRIINQDYNNDVSVVKPNAIAGNYDDQTNVDSIINNMNHEVESNYIDPNKYKSEFDIAAETNPSDNVDIFKEVKDQQIPNIDLSHEVSNVIASTDPFKDVSNTQVVKEVSLTNIDTLSKDELDNLLDQENLSLENKLNNLFKSKYLEFYKLQRQNEYNLKKIELTTKNNREAKNLIKDSNSRFSEKVSILNNNFKDEYLELSSASITKSLNIKQQKLSLDKQTEFDLVQAKTPKQVLKLKQKIATKYQGQESELQNEANNELKALDTELIKLNRSSEPQLHLTARFNTNLINELTNELSSIDKEYDFNNIDVYKVTSIEETIINETPDELIEINNNKSLGLEEDSFADALTKADLDRKFESYLKELLATHYINHFAVRVQHEKNVEYLNKYSSEKKVKKEINLLLNETNKESQKNFKLANKNCFEDYKKLRSNYFEHLSKLDVIEINDRQDVELSLLETMPEKKAQKEQQLIEKKVESEIADALNVKKNNISMMEKEIAKLSKGDNKELILLSKFPEFDIYELKNKKTEIKGATYPNVTLSIDKNKKTLDAINDSLLNPTQEFEEDTFEETEITKRMNDFAIMTKKILAKEEKDYADKIVELRSSATSKKEQKNVNKIIKKLGNELNERTQTTRDTLCRNIYLLEREKIKSTYDKQINDLTAQTHQVAIRLTKQTNDEKEAAFIANSFKYANDEIEKIKENLSSELEADLNDLTFEENLHMRHNDFDFVSFMLNRGYHVSKEYYESEFKAEEQLKPDEITEKIVSKVLNNPQIQEFFDSTKTTTQVKEPEPDLSGLTLTLDEEEPVIEEPVVKQVIETPIVEEKVQEVINNEPTLELELDEDEEIPTFDEELSFEEEQIEEELPIIEETPIEEELPVVEEPIIEEEQVIEDELAVIKETPIVEEEITTQKIDTVGAKTEEGIADEVNNNNFLYQKVDKKDTVAPVINKEELDFNLFEEQSDDISLEEIEDDFVIAEEPEMEEFSEEIEELELSDMDVSLEEVKDDENALDFLSIDEDDLGIVSNQQTPTQEKEELPFESFKNTDDELEEEITDEDEDEDDDDKGNNSGTPQTPPSTPSSTPVPVNNLSGIESKQINYHEQFVSNCDIDCTPIINFLKENENKEKTHKYYEDYRNILRNTIDDVKIKKEKEFEAEFNALPPAPQRNFNSINNMKNMFDKNARKIQKEHMKLMKKQRDYFECVDEFFRRKYFDIEKEALEFTVIYEKRRLSEEHNNSAAGLRERTLDDKKLFQNSEKEINTLHKEYVQEMQSIDEFKKRELKNIDKSFRIAMKYSINNDIIYSSTDNVDPNKPLSKFDEERRMLDLETKKEINKLETEFKNYLHSLDSDIDSKTLNTDIKNSLQYAKTNDEMINRLRVFVNNRRANIAKEELADMVRNEKIRLANETKSSISKLRDEAVLNPKKFKQNEKEITAIEKDFKKHIEALEDYVNIEKDNIQQRDINSRKIKTTLVSLQSLVKDYFADFYSSSANLDSLKKIEKEITKENAKKEKNKETTVSSFVEPVNDLTVTDDMNEYQAEITTLRAEAKKIVDKLKAEYKDYVDKNPLYENDPNFYNTFIEAANDVNLIDHKFTEVNDNLRQNIINVKLEESLYNNEIEAARLNDQAILDDEKLQNITVENEKEAKKIEKEINNVQKRLKKDLSDLERNHKRLTRKLNKDELLDLIFRPSKTFVTQLKEKYPSTIGNDLFDEDKILQDNYQKQDKPEKEQISIEVPKQVIEEKTLPIVEETIEQPINEEVFSLSIEDETPTKEEVEFIQEETFTFEEPTIDEFDNEEEEMTFEIEDEEIETDHTEELIIEEEPTIEEETKEEPITLDFDSLEIEEDVEVNSEGILDVGSFDSTLRHNTPETKKEEVEVFELTGKNTAKRYDYNNANSEFVMSSEKDIVNTTYEEFEKGITKVDSQEFTNSTFNASYVGGVDEDEYDLDHSVSNDDSVNSPKLAATSRKRKLNMSRFKGDASNQYLQKVKRKQKEQDIIDEGGELNPSLSKKEIKRRKKLKKLAEEQKGPGKHISPDYDETNLDDIYANVSDESINNKNTEINNKVKNMKEVFDYEFETNQKLQGKKGQTNNSNNPNVIKTVYFSTSYSATRNYAISNIDVNCISVSKYKKLYAVIYNMFQRSYQIKVSKYLRSKGLNMEQLNDVAKYQMLILSLLKHSQLNDIEWKFNIVEGSKDLLVVAINDIFSYLRKLTNLVKLTYSTPKIIIKQSMQVQDHMVNINMGTHIKRPDVFSIFNIDNEQFLSNLWIDNKIEYNLQPDENSYKFIGELISDLFDVSSISASQLDIIINSINGKNTLGLIRDRNVRIVAIAFITLMQPKISFVSFTYEEDIAVAKDILESNLYFDNVVHFDERHHNAFAHKIDAFKKANNILGIFIPEALHSRNTKLLIKELHETNKLGYFFIDNADLMNLESHDSRIWYILLPYIIKKYASTCTTLSLVSTDELKVIEDLSLEFAIQSVDDLLDANDEEYGEETFITDAEFERTKDFKREFTSSAIKAEQDSMQVLHQMNETMNQKRAQINYLFDKFTGQTDKHVSAIPYETAVLVEKTNVNLPGQNDSNLTKKEKQKIVEKIDKQIIAETKNIVDLFNYIFDVQQKRFIFKSPKVQASLNNNSLFLLNRLNIVDDFDTKEDLSNVEYDLRVKDLKITFEELKERTLVFIAKYKSLGVNSFNITTSIDEAELFENLLCWYFENFVSPDYKRYKHTDLKDYNINIDDYIDDHNAKINENDKVNLEDIDLNDVVRLVANLDDEQLIAHKDVVSNYVDELSNNKLLERLLVSLRLNNLTDEEINEAKIIFKSLEDFEQEKIIKELSNFYLKLDDEQKNKLLNTLAILNDSNIKLVAKTFKRDDVLVKFFLETVEQTLT